MQQKHLKYLVKVLISIILESLANLSRYLIPTIFSLPQRRADFVNIVKHLCEIYLQLNDDSVLYQISLSIVFLCDEDHTRSPEVKAAAKKTVSQLHGIITTDLLSNSKSLINCSISKEADTEYSLYLNLKRIKVLAKPVDLSKYLGNDSDDGNTLFEQFSNSIIDGLSHLLQKRKFVPPTNEDDSLSTNQEHNNSVVWGKNNESLHDVVAAVIQEGLEFLLCVDEKDRQ